MLYLCVFHSNRFNTETPACETPQQVTQAPVCPAWPILGLSLRNSGHLG